MAAQITVAGLSVSPSGEKIIGPVTIVGAATVGAVTDVNLGAGDNTITIPPGAIGVWIVPPAANTQALKLRTSLNSGDTGLPISATDPYGPFCWRGLSPTTLIINAAGTVNGVELTWV